MFGWKKRYEEVKNALVDTCDKERDALLEALRDKALLAIENHKLKEQLETYKSEEHALKMQRERVEIDHLALMNAKANLELQMLQREAQGSVGIRNAQHLSQGETPQERINSSES